MNAILHWLLLAAAVGTGWALGRWSLRRESDTPPIHDEETLRDRLQFLFTNYSDEAIESFVETLDVTRETVNLHLSIGAHFRNKGEVERATLIHQNLLARPELPARYSAQVTFELALDYLAAGLLDRAEALLQEMMGTRDYGPQAAEQLVELYQREREWEKACQVATSLVELQDGPGQRKQLAYLMCEQAADALVADPRRARELLEQALNYDRSCVRACLLLAELRHRDGYDREAQNLLLRVYDQNPAFGPEAVTLLVRFAREKGRERKLRRPLDRLYREHPSTTLLLILVDQEERFQGTDSARRLLENELARKPTLRGLMRLIGFNDPTTGPGSGSREQLVRRVGEMVLQNKPTYQCMRCGFSGHQLHWLCPSCKSWESIEPVKGVDGE